MTPYEQNVSRTKQRNNITQASKNEKEVVKQETSLFTFELTDDTEPEGGIEFNFCRRDKHRAVATVHTTETPEDEAEAAVGVETESDVAGGIQLALALHRVTQCSC